MIVVELCGRRLAKSCLLNWYVSRQVWGNIFAGQLQACGKAGPSCLYYTVNPLK